MIHRAGARSKEFADPSSGATNKRDADGTGEGILNGANTSSVEAEVSLHPR